MDNVVAIYDVVKATNGGLSALPDTAVSTNGSLITGGSGTNQITVSGGIASADAKKINAVATTSVTTINANQGTTQPVNFTGTGAAALAKSDMVDIAGAAVSTSSAQIGVNVVSQANIDFGALQKTSLNAATPASIVGAVGSVTGNVGGNVAGSVASVTAGVTVSTNNDKTGYTLSTAGVQAIWDALTSALTTVGSIGKLIVTNLDAAISSRSTYAGGAVASVTAAVTVGTNNDKTGYTLTSPYDAAKTAAQAGDAMTLTSAYDAAKTALDSGDYTAPDNATIASIGTTVSTNLDAKVSTRLAASSYTAPDNLSITAIKAKTDNLPADPVATSDLPTVWDVTIADHLSAGSTGAALNGAGGGSVTVGGYATGQDPATLVLDAVAASHNTSGSIGAKINASGSSADPLANPVPGSYEAGTAGYTLGQIPDIKAKTDMLSASQPVVVQTPVTGANVTIYRGDSYLSEDAGRQILIPFSSTVDVTGATGTLQILINSATFTKEVTISGSTTDQQIAISLTSDETNSMLPSKWGYNVIVTLSTGDVVTAVTGTWNVIQRPGLNP